MALSIKDTGRTPFWLFLILSVIILCLERLDGFALAHDVDDELRALQIKDLLSDGQWHDLVLPDKLVP